MSRFGPARGLLKWNVIRPINSGGSQTDTCSRRSGSHFRLAPGSSQRSRGRLCDRLTEADLDRYGLQSPDLELSFLQGTNNVAQVQFGASPRTSPMKFMRGARLIRISCWWIADWRIFFGNPIKLFTNHTCFRGNSRKSIGSRPGPLKILLCSVIRPIAGF